MTSHASEHYAPRETDADYLLSVREEELRQVGLEPYVIDQRGLALELRDLPSLYSADQDLVGILDVAGSPVKMYGLGETGVILAAPDFYLHQSRGRHARRDVQTNYVVVHTGEGQRTFGHGEPAAELLGLNTSNSSGGHFSVEVTDGDVVLRDNGATSSTRLIIAVPSLARHEDQSAVTAPASHAAIHTEFTSSMARLVGKLDETDSFAGRRLITRDSTIGGTHPEATVDLRSWSAGGEAIVVEVDDDPSGDYARLKQSVFDRIEALYGQGGKSRQQALTESEILKVINETVVSAMVYDLSYVDTLSEKLVAQGEEWRLVNLDYYLRAGKGICRHMALAAAWLGGELSELGMLSGRLTAEVNQRVADNAAHEWARYTGTNGEVFIIDPAGKYFGRLGDPSAPWNYLRPEEQWMAKRQVAGGLALAAGQ